VNIKKNVPDELDRELALEGDDPGVGDRTGPSIVAHGNLLGSAIGGPEDRCGGGGAELTEGIARALRPNRARLAWRAGPVRRADSGPSAREP
jgi:hypothetical protein